eukprot:TRINITY_DN15878_c0_g1_i1.p1 TRINITY_DN15878_c0_g1~~TRINITY_DN15878_c0_g1_i1.p1  ORF type:complete len:101 (-),score=38.46 TRINITY_DN15878_c0_g1_i1:2-304(-)
MCIRDSLKIGFNAPGIILVCDYRSFRHFRDICQFEDVHLPFVKESNLAPNSNAVFVANSDNGQLIGAFCATKVVEDKEACLLYTSPSPRDRTRSRMPSSA